MKKIFSERKAIRKPLTSKADDLVAVVVHAVNNFSENSPPETGFDDVRHDAEQP